MSIEVNNETTFAVDEHELVQLSRHVLDSLRVHPQAELSLVLVDEEAMERLHVQWMDLPGPTDVMSFPMDELRPGRDDEEPEPGLLGTSSCAPAWPSGRRPRAGTRPRRRSSCSRPTGSCTCWASTTPSRTRSG